MTTTKPAPPREQTARESAHLTARTPIEPGAYCDRCHMAPARARITTIGGGVLYLCRHHYEEHELVLETDVALTVYAEPNTCNCFQCTPPDERPEV